MPALNVLVVRDDSKDSNLTPTMLKLLIALVVLFVVALLIGAALLAIRCVKRSRHNKAAAADSDFSSEKLTGSTTYRRLTIETTNTTPAYAIQEKAALVDDSPPNSPLPEIRITFPDEVDNTGRPQSGRVVVVRMGDNNAMGLEPLDDGLPPYEKGNGRFQSLDLDRMGGLKEIEIEKRYS